MTFFVPSIVQDLSVFSTWDTVKIPGTPLVSLGQCDEMDNWDLVYVGHSEDPRDSHCVLGTVGRDGQWGMSVFNMWDTVKIPRTPLVSSGQWDGMDSGD